MLIIPGVLPVAPPAEQAFAVQPEPSTVITVMAATHPSKPRNETGSDSGSHSDKKYGAKRDPFPDPDRPVGPPPSFEANMLETEREKLRIGPNLEHGQDLNTPKSGDLFGQTPAHDQNSIDVTF